MRSTESEKVIAELNSVGIFAHISAVVVLIIFTLRQMLSGKNLEDSLFEPTFGGFLGPLLLLGLSYALFEFVNTFRKRRKYITVQGNKVKVVAQGVIFVGSPEKIRIEKGMVDNLVLEGRSGNRMEIRSYLIKGGAEKAKAALCNHLVKESE